MKQYINYDRSILSKRKFRLILRMLIRYKLRCLGVAVWDKGIQIAVAGKRLIRLV